MSDNLPDLPDGQNFIITFNQVAPGTTMTTPLSYTAEQMRAYALAERERCAKICEELERESGYAGKELEQAAAAIRKG